MTSTLPDIQTVVRRNSDDPGAIEPFLDDILNRIEACDDPAIWISRASRDDVMEQARVAIRRFRDGVPQPLLGVPFGVKDNIDVAGLPTTAACPAFAYLPSTSAACVKRLCDAGAIVIGKTNLDQFATGLVGTRSPYGICRNPFNARFISGGSSSGSAVAVSRGLVSFALGTDTAGSGRVPAAFNNIVGGSPTLGMVSTTGVVPACRTLDCVSVFAFTCDDVRMVLDQMRGLDPHDPYTRVVPPSKIWDGKPFRFGVPREDQLQFFGNTDAADRYTEAVAAFEAMGGKRKTIDFEPFLQTAKLLYHGPWVAKRLNALGSLLDASPDALLPVIRDVVGRGRDFDALAAYQGQYELKRLQVITHAVWTDIDTLLLPTTGTIYPIDEVIADPIHLNTNLGYYTNFLNLLDLAGVSVPSGFQRDGLPTGITLVGPGGTDEYLLSIADTFHRKLGLNAGATNQPLPPKVDREHVNDLVKVVVVGAHLSGQPLNHQLTSLNAKLVVACKTAPVYRLFALPGTVPPKPGLIRVAKDGGAIEVEVWAMSAEAFGHFVAAIPSPLGIGSIELDDGSQAKGFLCESYVTAGAADITHFGSWRAFLAGK